MRITLTEGNAVLTEADDFGKSLGPKLVESNLPLLSFAALLCDLFPLLHRNGHSNFVNTIGAVRNHMGVRDAKTSCTPPEKSGRIITATLADFAWELRMGGTGVGGAGGSWDIFKCQEEVNP